MLLDLNVKSLGMIGFLEKRHINSFPGSLDEGLSSQGMFGKIPPTMILLMLMLPYVGISYKCVPVLGNSFYQLCRFSIVMIDLPGDMASL